MTFVPGYIEKFLAKAADFESDALILDLEDSVPDAYKDDARRNIRDYLDRGVFSQQVYIRVNPIDSGVLLEDLKATIHANTTGFLLPKVDDERDIVYFEKLLTQLEIDAGISSNTFRICPLIETSTAVLRAFEIARASNRVVALAFGAEDYLTDLDGLHKEHGASLLVPRSLIVIAARAAKVEAIDTPYLNIRNLDGFRAELELARELGFSGTLILHPSQIRVANDAFTPSAEEIAEARRIVEAINESRKRGSGVTMLDGGLIGPPMMKRAESVLEKVRKIENGNGRLPSLTANLK